MSPTILETEIGVAFALLILSILLSFVRLVLGPSLADRVVALDMMTVTIVAFCALFSVQTDDPVFLDIAMVLALVGFLATVALARYAERRLEAITRAAEKEAKAKAAAEIAGSETPQ